MKSQLPFAVAFVLLVYSQSLGMVRADLEDQDLVDITCSKTYNPVFCTSTLRADPGSTSTDLKGLALIMLHAVQNRTNETFRHVEYLIGQTSDPVIKEMLNGCSTEYGVAAVVSCPDAIKQFGWGRFLFSQGDMDGVFHNAENCEGYFSCEEVVTDGTFGHCVPKPSPLTDQNNLVYTLARIAADIISTIN
ncbi:pectinesterase inhibitor-like [Corylus avellana]|uniref:pectinesterase inhibitor-like n=1 Tax=Corylus avellana TaxID=13451 RepID=UPI00286B55E4|nr:pectinesterase inhibitor-like [Corylus avellana]XP_059436084.1 pectinesterase inhibitor-like [Corylus avellana]